MLQTNRQFSIQKESYRKPVALFYFGSDKIAFMIGILQYCGSAWFIFGEGSSIRRCCTITKINPISTNLRANEELRLFLWVNFLNYYLVTPAPHQNHSDTTALFCIRDFDFAVRGGAFRHSLALLSILPSPTVLSQTVDATIRALKIIAFCLMLSGTMPFKKPFKTFLKSSSISLN